METVPSVQFRSWSLDIHKMWKQFVLEFHFCTFYDFKDLTFTTCNCCISILFVLPNHSRCLTCLNTTQTSTNHKKAQTNNLLGTKFRCSHQRRSTVCAAMTRTRHLNFSPPKEEMNGEEVWQMHKLTLIPIHTLKERISEAVVGIVVFASVSSRSLDRYPSWTPCDRSSSGTCWITWHLAKLHRRNYTRKTHGGTTHGWGNAQRAVWSHWSNQQRTLTNCSGIAQEIEWWTVRNSNSIHPNIKKRHVYGTFFFSDQGGSWHGLKCICSRVASVAQPPGV